MTVRSLVLLLVVGFAFSLVVPTVRSFLAQRAEVMALERDVEAARQRSAELDAELARWDDPAFVQWQARERLAFVMPGEVAYRVVDPETVQTRPDDAPEAPEPPSPGVLTPAADRPWFESIWESIQEAGQVEPADDDASQQAGDPDTSDADATEQDTGTAKAEQPAGDRAASDDAEAEQP